MSRIDSHTTYEAGCETSSPWGTWTRNDYFHPIHTKVYPDAKQQEISRQTHGAKQKRTEAANAKRKQLIAASGSLKQDWFDAPYWRHLARSRHFRFADYYQPITTRGIRRTLTKLSLTGTEFRKYFGEITYNRYVSLNPNVPLWAFQGILLELLGRP